MSQQHPIIAVTGSAGAGSTTVRHAFADIFRRQGLNPALVKGDSFFRYDLKELKRLRAEWKKTGQSISFFGPEANLFDRLEGLFAQYGKNGGGEVRHFIQDEDDVKQYGAPHGSFTEWNKLPRGTDLLFYEGMHGGVAAHTWTRRGSSPAHLPEPMRERRGKRKGVNAAQHVDLLLGVVPAVNLEWIQKIHRDCNKHGCNVEDSIATILRRMRDYTHFIVPQFGLTDINFQRMPLVDTSDPFIARDIPTADESIVIVHFRDPKRFDFPALLKHIEGARMSRPNTMFIAGGKMRLAIEVICGPLIEEMMHKKTRKGRA